MGALFCFIPAKGQTYGGVEVSSRCGDSFIGEIQCLVSFVGVGQVS
jgi:hypothetical protein